MVLYVLSELLSRGQKAAPQTPQPSGEPHTLGSGISASTAHDASRARCYDATTGSRHASPRHRVARVCAPATSTVADRAVDAMHRTRSALSASDPIWLAYTLVRVSLCHPARPQSARRAAADAACSGTAPGRIAGPARAPCSVRDTYLLERTLAMSSTPRSLLRATFAVPSRASSQPSRASSQPSRASSQPSRASSHSTRELRHTALRGHCPMSSASSCRSMTNGGDGTW